MSKSSLVRGLIFFLLVSLTIPLLGMVSAEGLKYLGVKTVTVEVVGTGSMYPSLFWDQSEGGPEDTARLGTEEYRSSPRMYRRFAGLELLGNHYFFRPVGYGDMIAFQNDHTAAILQAEGKNPQIGFIKRVIGLPGDTIELRDGYVIKNGQLLAEPYLYRPRSTYGGKNMADCQVLTVPPGSYFVLGDNRKISTDSRGELGLVTDQSILFILPFSEQGIYHSLWRDPSKDAELLGTPTLDRQSFYALVNQVRAKSSRVPLKPSAELAASSAMRGTRLLTDPDTSYSLHSALSAAGYSNIVYGEFVSYGRFTAEELLQNILSYGETAKQIMHGEYQDIGVTATTKEVNGCPTQIIVGHLGGYVPAEYSETTLTSWRSLRESLPAAITSWEQAVGYNNLSQEKVFALLDILRRRLALTDEVIGVMEAKRWFTDEQTARIDSDQADAKQAEALSRELNGD